MIEDETLYAWLDGELSPDEARRVAAAVEADPALSARLEAQRRLRARLRAAFDPVADESVPGIYAVLPDTNVFGIGEARAARAQRRGFGPPQWAALAAALVAGLFGGHMLSQGAGVQTAVQDDHMAATAEVAAALDTQLASAGTVEAPIHVRLTFRDANGAICRSYDTATASGVACRESGAWTIRALFAHDGPPVGTYRMAGTANAATMTYLDAIMVGEPFDAEAERRARQSGWAQR